MKKKYLFIGLALLLIDQITKILLVDVNIDFGFFALNYVKNTGISFGLFQGYSFLVIIISLIVLVWLYFIRKEFAGKEIFLVLIVSGIIGNLIDRVFLGFVRDFFDLKWWPVFNVADSLLFVGVIGLIIFVLIKSKPLNSKNTNK